MNGNKQIIKQCPRCGYPDTGKYCSQCSYELDADRENVFNEIYHSFILKFLDKLPFIGIFIKTWWSSFITPGKINLEETYTEKPKFLNDIKFLTTLFYLAVGSAIIKSIATFDASQTENSNIPILNFIFDLFIQSYVLWIFGFMSLTFIWTGRIWRKWMKMKVEEQRYFDSIFIYELGTILTIVITLFWVIDYKLGDKISYNFKITLITLAILTVLHFFYLLLIIGIREKLPIKKLVIISIICTYLFLFIAVVAELITLPILLLPIIILLSPIFYLFRSFYKRIKKPKLFY